MTDSDAGEFRPSGVVCRATAKHRELSLERLSLQPVRYLLCRCAGSCAPAQLLRPLHHHAAGTVLFIFEVAQFKMTAYITLSCHPHILKCKQNSLSMLQPRTRGLG